MDATGCLIAGDAILMSIFGMKIDVDDSGRSKIKRTACPFCHTLTKSEKLVSAMVLLLGLGCVVPLIFGFAFDIEKLVVNYSKAIRGGARGVFPCIQLGVCRPHISRALLERK